MTVKVRIEIGGSRPEWGLSYSEGDRILYAGRRGSAGPLHTLQGSYDLLLGADEHNRIAEAEAVMSAEPRHWTVSHDIKPPQAEPGEVYVVEDMDDGQRQQYFTDSNRGLFYARLGEPRRPEELQCVLLGKGVVVEVAPDGVLCGFWLLGLPPTLL